MNLINIWKLKKIIANGNAEEITAELEKIKQGIRIDCELIKPKISKKQYDSLAKEVKESEELIDKLISKKVKK